jgi:hypothetical protein
MRILAIVATIVITGMLKTGPLYQRILLGKICYVTIQP